ncbi:MAG: TonB-dependent receptor plug domain-containing protein, partial [Desulfobacteraceae bacterium]|nr:TonB-dependent receptor plug domain-containing protein [Desulfobacteraceae bacterium]
MKAVYNLLLTIFFIVFIPTCLVSAQEDQKKSEIFDLGDVLVLEKSGDVSKVTTTNTISIEDIEQTGAKNVAEALEQVAGIDISNHSKGGPTLKMRGFDQKNVKILIDGVPAHETYFGELDLGNIPVDTIAKIEIIKGASSVLYGPNTMGGVINIITKKGSKDFFSKITTSFGEHGTQNLILNHVGAKGKFNYWLTYSS